MDDEPLFAEKRVYYVGQPIALVLAGSENTAMAAARKIRVEIDPLPAITDPREAVKKGALIGAPRTFSLGNTDKAWEKCDHVFDV